jgi:hypothetical protein
MKATRFRGRFLFALVWALLSTVDETRAFQGPAPLEGSTIASDGSRWTGRIVGDARSGFRFEARGGDPIIPLERIGAVDFPERESSVRPSPPPFQLRLGHGQWVSGHAPALNDREVRLEIGPSGRRLSAQRGGVLELRQRPGEALALLESFEDWDDSEWARQGELALDDQRRRDGRTSLRVPSAATSLSYALPEPLESGWFSVAFHHGGQTAEGVRWFVELGFREQDGRTAPIRAVLGWSMDTPAVESPEGPALAVQRLILGEGWHTLSAQFDRDRLELAIDGASLARGPTPSGRLAEIRIASERQGTDSADLTAHLDDLRLVRRVQPPRSVQVDPEQDDARLINGDQLFGRLLQADRRQILLEMDGHRVPLEWSEVASLRFRRDLIPGEPLSGLLARLEWSAGTGQNLDRAEGVLTSVSQQGFTLQTPYAGELMVPGDQMRRLEVLGQGTRLVLDPTPHHLGDQYMENLDPPQPEGGTFQLQFHLQRVPDSPALLALDVFEVAGEADSLPYAEFIRNKELRTNVVLNGRLFDYLNRHVRDQNETVTRIGIPIPPGLLQVGENRLRFEQTGKLKEPTFLDDMGLLEIALEFRPVARESP